MQKSFFPLVSPIRIDSKSKNFLELINLELKTKFENRFSASRLRFERKVKSYLKKIEPQNADDDDSWGYPKVNIHAKTLSASIFKRKIYITSAHCSKGISTKSEEELILTQIREVIRQMRSRGKGDERASGEVFFTFLKTTMGSTSTTTTTKSFS